MHYEVSISTLEGIFLRNIVYYTHFRKNCKVCVGKKCEIRHTTRKSTLMWESNMAIWPLRLKSSVCRV